MNEAGTIRNTRENGAGASAMNAIAHDVRYAIRRLWKNRSFTLVVVLTLFGQVALLAVFVPARRAVLVQPVKSRI